MKKRQRTFRSVAEIDAYFRPKQSERERRAAMTEEARLEEDVWNAVDPIIERFLRKMMRWKKTAEATK